MKCWSIRLLCWKSILVQREVPKEYVVSCLRFKALISFWWYVKCSYLRIYNGPRRTLGICYLLPTCPLLSRSLHTARGKDFKNASLYTRSGLAQLQLSSAWWVYCSQSLLIWIWNQSKYTGFFKFVGFGLDWQRLSICCSLSLFHLLIENIFCQTLKKFGWFFPPAQFRAFSPITPAVRACPARD